MIKLPVKKLKLKFVSGKMGPFMLFPFILRFILNFNCEGGAKC